MKAMRMNAFVVMVTVLMVSISAAAYPLLRISPVNPVAGQDVQVQVRLGVHPDGCVPTYKDLVIDVTQSPALIYPPIFNVSVSYTEVPYSGTGNCTAAFTEYGPVFTIQKPEMGSYHLWDDGKLVGTFSVSEGTVVLRGKVTDDPWPNKRMPTIIGNARIHLMPMAATLVYDPLYQQDSAFSSRSGTYYIPMRANMPYLLTVSANGFVTRRYEIVMTQDSLLDVALLAKGASAGVTGSVKSVSICAYSGSRVTCDSQPVPNASVFVDFGGFCNMTPYPAEPMSAERPLFDNWIDCSRFRAMSGNDGTYSVKDIPLEYNGTPVWVWASHNGVSSDTVETALYNGMIVKADLTMKGVPGTGVKAAGPANLKRTAGSVSWHGTSGTVRIDVRKRSEVVMTAYTSLGRLIPGLGAQRVMEPGVHSIPVTGFRTGGVVHLVVRIGDQEVGILNIAPMSSER